MDSQSARPRHLLIEVLPETMALNSSTESTTAVMHLARLALGRDPSLCIDERYIDLWFGPRIPDADLWRLITMMESFGFEVEVTRHDDAHPLRPVTP